MTALRKFVVFLYSKIVGLFSKGQFKIKKGYRHRIKYRYYDGTHVTDEYQFEVYLEVKRYMEDKSFKTIIDIGCGSAFKLMNYLNSYDTIGLDVTDTCKFLKQKYPNRKWVNVDEFHDYDQISADIVICADVIEHVLRPDLLLENISRIKNFKYLFLSTPERDIMRGFFDFGPPGNVHHIREWNGREFRSFVSQYFDVVSHKITNYEHATQLLICKKHNQE